jgi:hypothetical protein
VSSRVTSWACQTQVEDHGTKPYIPAGPPQLVAPWQACSQLFAEFEREIRRKRTLAGLAHARENGSGPFPQSLSRDEPRITERDLRVVLREPRLDRQRALLTELIRRDF